MERLEDIKNLNLVDQNIAKQPDGFYESKSSAEIEEIISIIPSWILRRGIMVIFCVLVGLVLLSALIRYPDIVKTGMKVSSLNAPKAVRATLSGKLTRILIEDGQNVSQNQPLAYLESTASAENVVELLRVLNQIRGQILANQMPEISMPNNLNLGELQLAYKSFYQEYLQYSGTINHGYYSKKMKMLEKEITTVNALRTQIVEQKKVQKQEFANQEQEYNAYQKLYKNKVVSRSEFASQENKFFAAKYPLQQIEISLLNNSASITTKEKEIMEIQNAINTEKSKFIQAISQCTSEAEDWVLKHILKSPISGKITFAGIIQQSQNVNQNQEVFIVNPGNTDFFGEVQIPQYNMGKVKLGQAVIVKLHGFPYEQYGIIKGKLTYISDAAFKDSVFIAKVNFQLIENKSTDRRIVLKNGMSADAEIVTQESSLLKRFYTNIIRVLN